MFDYCMIFCKYRLEALEGGKACQKYAVESHDDYEHEGPVQYHCSQTTTSGIMLRRDSHTIRRFCREMY